MNNELISIIIPVYNAEKTIKRCLSSLVSQTYFYIEVIIINDGSTDKSLEIITTFENKIKNLKIINQTNKGVSVARNEGLKVAKGQYIIFLDSDDYLDKTCCEVSINSMKDSDLVIFGLNIYKNDILLRTPHLEKECLHLKNNINNYWKLRTINLGPCNKLYKKKLITDLFDEHLSLGEDTKFVIDYLKNVNFVNVIPQCLYNVNLDNNQSLNRKYRKDRLDQLISVRNYEKDMLDKLYQCYDARIYNEYIYDIHVILHDIIKRKLSIKYIKENVDKFDYGSLKEYVHLKNKYYSLFFYFVSHRYYLSVCLLLKIRIFIESIKGVS